MPVILLGIASCIVYKKMKGPGQEEFEMAKRMNKEQSEGKSGTSPKTASNTE